jgi:hypothetical protein
MQKLSLLYHINYIIMSDFSYGFLEVDNVLRAFYSLTSCFLEVNS